MIVKKLAEIIRIRIYGGQPSDDAPITLRQIAVEILNEASQSAKESFYENANVEGYNYVDDSFTTRYTGVAVSNDVATGLKYSTLPSSVVALPKNRGIVDVYPGYGFSAPFLKIASKDVGIYTQDSGIPNSILYWLEGGRIYYYPCGISVPNQVVIKMIGQLNAGLTDELNVSGEALKQIEDRVVAKFMPVVSIPIDKANDNTPTRDIQ